MFSSFHDRGPPAIVTTIPGKRQYGEQDWCTSPAQQQQQQYRDARNDYNINNGANSLIDERDTSCIIPLNNYQHGSLISPTHNLKFHQPQHYNTQPQQKLSRTEVATYMSAIKAVNESMMNSEHNNSRGGSVTALRGLWRVFDAAMNELGSELNDSLSNKAIFEGKLLWLYVSHHVYIFYTHILCSYHINYYYSKCTAGRTYSTG